MDIIHDLIDGGLTNPAKYFKTIFYDALLLWFYLRSELPSKFLHYLDVVLSRNKMEIIYLSTRNL